jgi:LAS superfamily LD-carboxypeptidase LdcB
MRLLPANFVIHQWVMEGSRLKMSPISVSVDGRTMHLARPETVQAYNRMAKDALMQNVHLKIIWAYRSAAIQTEQFQLAQKKHGMRSAIRWLAPPGYSEHHTGWALDIGDEKDEKADDNPLFERTAAFRWLKANAKKYGFEMSFPPKNWQGVGYEPWHWRFVGTPEAQRAFHPKSIAAVGIWGLSWVQAVKSWIGI